MIFSKVSKKDFIFFSVLSVITIIATASVYVFQFNSPPIRSDGIGYYSYLPALFIHGDMSMKTLMQERADKYNAEVPTNWNGLNIQEDGKFLDKYTMGEAVLMAPFFIPAHFLSIIFKQPLSGFSLFYQAAMAFSGLFYMITGLFILKKILEKYFKNKTIYITLTVLTFGTNLFHYATYDSIFSHAYSFFLFALFLYLLPIWFKNIKSIKYSIFLGILVGLITLVRPTNVTFPIIFILFLSLNLKQIKERLVLFWENKKSLVIAVITSIIVSLPQLLYWKSITGKWFVFSYQGEYFDFLRPQILNVLFSAEKGLFFWCPVLIFGIVGIFLLKDKLKQWVLPSVVFFIVNLLVISSWWAWAYGGGFGHRAFIESFAIVAIPLAACIDRILKLENKRFKIAIFILIGILIFVCLFTMFNYWVGILKPEGTSFGMFVRLFIKK